jgi:AhpD family alkylhydroperoxidase
MLFQTAKQKKLITMVEEFNAYRQKMNEVILSQDNKVIKRFFSLDNQTYEDGALPEVTKELLGLVASMVLRCDDCIKYHLGRCHELGVTKDQIYEACSVALVVGGSIFIPHMRRAAEYWEELEGGL